MKSPMKMQITSCVLLCLLSVVVCDDTDAVFELMSTGDEQIDLGDYENYVVVLGLTGSGKSTLIKLLAGDNRELQVIKPKHSFLFDDGNKTISTAKSTLTSRTLYPDVTYNKQLDLAFVDTPGFSDSRSTEHEIAANYFINNVFLHVSQFKIILTIGMNSVSEGGSRTALAELMNHIVKLFVNFEILKDSIVVMVTKVDNDPDYPDERFANDIREFLTEAKSKVIKDIKVLKTKSNSAEQIQEKENQSKLIDLINDNSEICIFRKPNQTGIVSEIGYMQVSKAQMQSKLNKSIFVSKGDIKTGSAISGNGRLYIRDSLLPSLKVTLHRFFTHITSSFHLRFSMKSLETENYLGFVSELRDIESIFDNSISITEFQNMLTSLLKSSNLTFHVKNVEKMLQKLEFFMTVAGIHKNTINEYSKYTKKIESGVSNLKNWFQIIAALQDRFESYIKYEFLGQEIMSIKNNIVTNENLNIFLVNVSHFSNDSEISVDAILSNPFHDFDSIVIFKLNNITHRYIHKIQFKILPLLKWKLYSQLISVNKAVFNVMDSKIDVKNSNQEMVLYLKNVTQNCKKIDVKNFEICFRSVLNKTQNKQIISETNKIYSNYLYMKTLVGFNASMDYKAFSNILHHTKIYMEQIINWH